MIDGAPVEVEGVRLAVKELAAVDFASLSSDELSALTVSLFELRESLHALHARAARAWDVDRSWVDDGAKSPAAWLARATRMSKAECRSLVWLGRTFALWPPMATAWEAGEISASHVRKLRSLTKPRTIETFERDQHVLLDLARRLTFADFERACDYWLQRADADGADRDASEQHAQRRVSLDETTDGMWSGAMWLDPVSGMIVSNELRRVEQELFDADWSEARERLGREPAIIELARTPDQRRADALVVMAQRSAGASPRASTKPLFTVVMGSEAMARLCELASGRVVAPGALVPFIDAAMVEGIVFDTSGQRAIGVSQQRVFRGVLRRIVEVRDRRCYHEWCDEPADRCQVDHIQPDAAGGPTSQENGRLACGFHNRLRNQRPPPPKKRRKRPRAPD